MATKDVKFTATGLDQILAKIGKINKEAEKVETKKIKADTSQADSAVKTLNKKANSTETMKVKADTSNADSKIKALLKMANKTETIKVKADTSDAESDVNSLGDKIKDLAVIGAVSAGVKSVGESFLSTEAAISQMANRLGTTTGEAEGLIEIGKNVYKQGWGESLEQINAGMVAIADIDLQIEGFATSAEDMQLLALGAAKVTDTFGGDIQENIRAAGQLAKNFGISGNDAFDIITTGFQQGANASGDFIETLNEYGVQFKALGFNAEEFTKTLIEGAKTGAFNIDFMADAIKEFSIRAVDGSQTSADGFKALGLNADEMTKKFAQGGEVAKNSFDEVVAKLLDMKDPVAQNAAGVALFGTKFEDIKAKGVSAFRDINVEAGKYKGAVAAIETEDPGAFLKIKLREAQVFFEETFKKIFAFLKSIDWEGIFAPFKAIVDGLGPILKPILDSLGAFFTKVGENEQASQILTAVASAILLVAAAFIIWQTAMWLMTAATTAFSIVFSPIGLIILGIIAIVALIILAVKNWGAITDWLGQKWEEFKTWIIGIFNGVLAWLGENWPYILGILTGPIGLAVALIAKNWEKIVEGAKWALDKVKEFGNGIVDFFKSIPQKIGDAFSSLGDIIKQAFGSAINLLPGPLQGPLKSALGLFDTEFQQLLESAGTITLDTSRFDFLPSQMASQTYNNQQSYTFNKGIESVHERKRLTVNMKKVRGR